MSNVDINVWLDLKLLIRHIDFKQVTFLLFNYNHSFAIHILIMNKFTSYSISRDQI